MSEVRKAKKNGSGKGVGAGKKMAGDTKAKLMHGTQGGSSSTPRANSPRVPTGRAGGKGGGPKRG